MTSVLLREEVDVIYSHIRGRIKYTTVAVNEKYFFVCFFLKKNI